MCAGCAQPGSGTPDHGPVHAFHCGHIERTHTFSSLTNLILALVAHP